MSAYALKSSSTYRGKPLWFHMMTGIGPKTTTEESERAVFAMREDALRCPALRHLLSSYEIVEIVDAD